MDGFKEISKILDDLCEYCISDELSLPGLQEKMKKLDRFHIVDISENYPFHPLLHNVLWNKRVTLEIIEYLLDKFPGAAAVESESHKHQYEKFGTINTYPLHLACHNQHCPSSIITLLMEKHKHALKHFAYAGDLFSCGDYDDYAKGLPLHYYVARASNKSMMTIVVYIIPSTSLLLPFALALDTTSTYLPKHLSISSR